MRSFILAATAMTIVISTGCGRKSSPTNPPTNDVTPPSRQEVHHNSEQTPPYLPPIWKIKYNAKCAATSTLEDCPGGYGFILSSNGMFKVGPGPDGQLYDGPLSADEFKALKKKIIKIQTTIPRIDSEPRANLKSEGTTDSNQTCIPSESTYLATTIDLTIRDIYSAQIRSTNTEMCYSSITQADAVELSNLVHNIVTKYHPEKFPNNCINANHHLEKIYKSMQECEQDSDCSYIGHDFLPLDTENIEEFIADDCSFVRPMIVANSFSAVSNQLKLLSLQKEAHDSCGKDKKRIACKPSKKMSSVKNAPVCVKGFCSLSPYLKMK